MKKLTEMKYYSAILSLVILSFFSVIFLLYFANLTRNIEKENLSLLKDIKYFEEQININEIEYSLYDNYEYLQKMQNIYFDKSEIINLEKRISFNDFINKNLSNFYTIATK